MSVAWHDEYPDVRECPFLSCETLEVTLSPNQQGDHREMPARFLGEVLRLPDDRNELARWVGV